MRQPRRRLSNETLLRRLLSRRFIDPVTGCWIFTGNRGRRGYGSQWDGERQVTISRLSAQLLLGMALGDGRHVLHRCDVPPCFNPAHLFLGTAADNWQDCVSKGRAFQLAPRSKEQAGEKNAQAKLTWDIVREIRARYGMRQESQHALARRFGVTQSLISMVVNEIIWKPEGELQ